MARQYNTGGSTSDIGATQLQDFYYQKKALIELKKEQYFLPMASVIGMPKHMGKTIKRYHYLPLLDDRNVNDQGIDAQGALMSPTEYSVQVPTLVGMAKNIEADETSWASAYKSGQYVYTSGNGWVLTTAATAVGYDSSTAGGTTGTVIADSAIKALIEDDMANYLNGTTVTATVSGSSITVDQLALVYSTAAKANIVLDLIAGASSAPRYGNLYASSKDVGTIVGKLPALSEVGGQVNKVSFTRIQLEGSISKFGFYDEYTQESLDFDSDSELQMHINREMLRGAQEMTEDALQIDLLNSAGVIHYAGIATSKAEITGVAADTISEVDYGDLSALNIIQDDNRCPKETKIISGTRMVDTKTIPASRVMFIGSAMQPTFERMVDFHNERAFIPVEKYAAGTTIMNGEIGSVGHFRIVVVPEMVYFAGAGAAEGVNAGYRATNGRYDVFPLLVVGSESFTTIGFQTSGQSVKFKIYHKAPGREMATALDPYGEKGFMSIKWYYGFMALRDERIAVIYSVARY